MSVGGPKLTPVPLGWLSRDARLIILARGLRAFGQGTVSVLLAIYLDLLGFSLIQIGLFISAGLAGAAFYSFLIVFLGDALGRRRLLVAFALLPATAALVLTATDSFPLLAAVALLGSFGVAGGGAAAGPAQPVEQVSLADMVPPERRTDLYALYGIMGAGGASLGALAAGLPDLYQGTLGLAQVSALKVVFVTFAALLALVALCYSLLSPSVEVATSGSRWVNPFRLPSRRLIFTLTGLFSVDHFSGGLVVQSLVALWFFTKFGVALGSIGLVFFGSSLMSAISLWGAAKLANRIGLINTMVFTHIPSSLLLIAIPFLPTAWLAASFWLARGFFSQMDVPPRQSYTMAVVGPNERVAMAGINTVARSMAGTVSPSVAAVLWNIGAASIPFISCGVLKISYDLSLYFMFRNVRPPEEQVRVETARQP